MGHLARQVSGYREHLRVIPKERKVHEPSQVHCFLFCFVSMTGINNKYLRHENKIVKINRNLCNWKSEETLKLSSSFQSMVNYSPPTSKPFIN